MRPANPETRGIVGASKRSVMRLTLNTILSVLLLAATSSTAVCELNCGLVQGATAPGTSLSSGVPVHCFITRIAVHEGQDHSEFERELQEYAAPSPDVAAIPLRLVL